MPELLQTAVRQFFEARPAPRGAVLLAAVSGGADSLALLHALADLRGDLGITLHAGYLNHGMRAEADADARFVADVCGGLGVGITVERADVPALAAQRRVSLEVAGREARYAFLYRAAHALGAFALCTGHTLDDQAETMLLRITAGTGLPGLAGIAPARLASPPETPAPLWILRPMLSVRRAETAAFCASLGLPVVDDPANHDPRYPRNRVRHTLLPLLESQFNPAVREALARLADIARVDDETLSRLADDVPLLSVPGGAGVLLAQMLGLPLALQRRVARRLLEAAGASGHAMGYANVEAVVGALASSRARRSLDGGLEARRRETALEVLRAVPRPAPAYECRVALPGITPLPGGEMEGALVDGGPISRDPWTATLDADRLREALTLRTRRPGDRMRPLGMCGSRKLADILTDRKAPPEVRRLPVLACGDRVAWLPGAAVSEEFRVSESTRQVAYFTLRMPLITTHEADGHTGKASK
jgi:tRNA(Ile)-lysidine synthase